MVVQHEHIHKHEHVVKVDLEELFHGLREFQDYNNYNNNQMEQSIDIDHRMSMTKTQPKTLAYQKYGVKFSKNCDTAAPLQNQNKFMAIKSSM